MPRLSFDWEIVLHQTVTGVLGRGERRMNDGTLSCDEIALVLGEHAVLLDVNDDTDEVEIEHGLAPTSSSWAPIASLQDIVGKALGWCWVGTNYRGYQDSFTLAFGLDVPDALEPRLMFLGEGSRISCFALSPR